MKWYRMYWAVFWFGYGLPSSCQCDYFEILPCCSCISSWFLLVAEQSSVVSGRRNLLIHFWLMVTQVGCSHFMTQIKQLWASAYRCLYGHGLSLLPVLPRQKGWLMSVYVKHFRKLPNFSKGAASFPIPPVVCESSMSSISWLSLATASLLSFSHSSRCL